MIEEHNNIAGPTCKETMILQQVLGRLLICQRYNSFSDLVEGMCKFTPNNPRLTHNVVCLSRLE